MKKLTNDPVVPVPFGTAMQVSLNNYYDLLKAQAGNLGANEFLQLKLTADPVDITAKKNVDGGYEWFSYYNLLNRADLEIDPAPLSGSALTGVAAVSDLYGKFLAKLSSFVLIKELSPDDQQKKSDLDAQIDAITTQIGNLADADYVAWKKYCELRGTNPGDFVAYNQWARVYGHAMKIQELMDTSTQKNFQVIQIIDRKYSDPGDQEIVNALVDYRSPSMKLCFPLISDYNFLPTIINLQYLMSLPPVNAGEITARYFTAFDMDISTIKNTTAGAFAASFSQATGNSNSINTDWSASGSIGYFFINVRASAASSTTITEDFQKATAINLGAKAAFRVNINYGSWFKANLFKSKYVKKNPQLFLEFFGVNGSLLYYPTALILVRGFNAEFTSSQNWSYDYKHSFSESAGGGFSVFGINFGGSQTYGENVASHQVDQSNTSLKFADDDSTLRFVGYAVKENDLIAELTVEMQERLTANFISHEKA